MSEEEVTLPKNCIKSMKLGLHLSHQTLKSQRPFPWVWWMSMAAVAIMLWQDTPAAWAAFQRGSSTGAETHLGSTVSPAPKLKWCFLTDFFPCGYFLKGVKFLERSSNITYTEKNFSPTGCFGYLNISYLLLTIPTWWHSIICLAVVKHCCHVLKLSLLQAPSSIALRLKHFVLE